MSGAVTRIPLAEARESAGEVIDLLAPWCERIEIAGSIRRGRPDIGDIEIVCRPILQESLDLFGAIVVERRNMLDEWVAELLADGVFGHRPDKNGHNAVGERYKRLTYDGIPLDLFSVLEPAQWGVIFAIRTGSSGFSHRLVTPISQGGWMPPTMNVKDGALWKNGNPIPVPEEVDLFAALGRDFVDPKDRYAPEWD
jgi:DNA polymerase/3'-5' exonuclease PolX